MSEGMIVMAHLYPKNCLMKQFLTEFPASEIFSNWFLSKKYLMSFIENSHQRHIHWRVYRFFLLYTSLLSPFQKINI